jgi:type I restriction enzyme R subunit
MPVFRILRAEVFDNAELTDDQIAINVDLTQNLFNAIENEMQFRGFWGSKPAQLRLGAELQAILLSEQFKALPNIFSKYKQIISRTMEWARENQSVFKQ